MDVEDVLDVNERLLYKLFKELLNVEIPQPIPRMTWQEAMDRFDILFTDISYTKFIKNQGCNLIS